MRAHIIGAAERVGVKLPAARRIADSKGIEPCRSGRRHAISDVCLLVEDIERTVDFYVDKLGFRLRRRAEGFRRFP